MKKILTIIGLFLTIITYGQIDTLDISRFLNAGNGRRQGNEAVKINTFMLAVNGTNYFIAASNATATEKSIANVLCDGTADQVQINAAITAGYNVRLSSGQFNIAAAITASVNNVTIEGTGKEKTIIFLSNGANSNVLEVGGNFWVIKNLMINGNLASNTGTCSGIYGTGRTDVVINNCEIKNVEDHAIYVFGTSNAWYITNCYNHDSGTAIKGTTFGGQAPYNIFVSYCRFHNTTAASQIHVRTEDVIATGPYNWNVDHCTITGTTGYMGILFELAKNCNVTNCYLAVDEAPGAGNPANVRYKDGASGKVIGNTFAGNGNTTDENYAAISLWGVVDIIVSGNYFTSLASKDGSGISVEAYSTGYNVSHITIEGNTFYNLSTNDLKEIISLQAATTYTLSDVNITGNIFKDDRGAGAYSTYAVGTTDAGTVSNINISDNVIEGLLYQGINIAATASDNIKISNNTFIDLPIGVLADDGDDLMIIGNKFVVCATPIDVNDADVTRPLVTENTMYGCTNSGTYAGATGELFGNNLWHDGTYDATAP